jgi:hypothetical protein
MTVLAPISQKLFSLAPQFCLSEFFSGSKICIFINKRIYFAAWLEDNNIKITAMKFSELPSPINHAS